MKYRDIYINSTSPIWEITYDVAIAAFDFNIFWLGEIKGACKELIEKYPEKKDIFRTLLNVTCSLYNVAQKREWLQPAY